MRFKFHPVAENELIESIEYYESCRSGLGLDFELQVENAVRLSIEYPAAWPEIAPGIRRCLLQRFPFGVIYSVEDDGILVLAVMHLHREPGYWQDRA